MSVTTIECASGQYLDLEGASDFLLDLLSPGSGSAGVRPDGIVRVADDVTPNEVVELVAELDGHQAFLASRAGFVAVQNT